MRHEADYIGRTIATVRNHRDADNCWPQWANIFADQIEDQAAELERLRNALLVVRRDSLLRVRRAAFGPELGVRYTEKIRAEIGNEIWRLEQFVDATLDR